MKPGYVSCSGERIAIVGIGCRFPGGSHGPERLWRALVDGRNAVSEGAGERFAVAWADAETLFRPASGVTAGGAAAIVSRHGGFLADIDSFDAGFFGISPREAASMDPQQRLLVEVAWEALEDAGQPCHAVLAERTGVFVGMMSNDYEDLAYADLAALDLYSLTGAGRYAASGRVSHVFGLGGPSVTIDSACSASLVAVHQAVQSLRLGECDLALAAGVNLLLLPQINVSLSRGRILAPDGRCKFGDASANGFVRSEGVGVVVLRRLADAEAAGDPVRAVLLGSAVNNDGGSGRVFSTPSVEAQKRLVRDACRNAGIAPGTLGYVEAHGTGTAEGDPVEINALAAALAEGRDPGQRCAMGSIKTNLGHTEGAAGVAGLIKAVLALQHRTIPASLHFETPNPRVAWSSIPLRVARETSPWPAGSAPRRAGVNSFGLTGTNAHVILEEFVPEEGRDARTARTPPPYVLPVSARDPEALRELGRRYATRAEMCERPSDFADLCYTASVRRRHHPLRFAVAFRDRQELLDGLRGLVAGPPRRAAPEGRPLFLCPPPHASAAEMGAVLGVTEPSFQAGLAAVAALQPSGRPNATFETFALQVALAHWWRGLGVEPGSALGWGAGTVAADWLRGRLSLEDAVAALAACDAAPDAPAPADAIRSALSERAGPVVTLGVVAPAAGFEAARLHALDPADPRASLMAALAGAYAGGAAIDWPARYPDGGVCVALPAYPWQRARFWLRERPGRRRSGPPLPAYRVEWRSVPVPESRSDARGAWLIAGDGRGLGPALAAALQARGHACTLTRGAAAAPGDATRIVCLQALDEAARPDDAHLAWSCRGTLERLATGCAGRRPPRVWWVTRGAWRLDGDAPPPAAPAGPSHAAVWGFARVARLEHAELWGGLVDLGAGDAGPDPSGLARDAERLVEHILADDGEDQVALRDRGRFGARLAPAPEPGNTPDAPRGDVTYLITGGLGGLGRAVACWMVAQGARHLLLLGRNTGGAGDLLAELRATGARVEARGVDVADFEALAQVLSECGAEGAMPRLGGVVHAAGVVEDGLLRHQTEDAFRRVLAPKVAGSWNLHRLTRDLDLDLFVLFSSATATLGSLGQASYAAANAYLDALAEHRRALSLPAVSIAWGPWAESGMVARLEHRARERQARLGLHAASNERALASFGQMMDGRRAPAHVVALECDWTAFAQQQLSERQPCPPLLRELVGAPDSAAPRPEAAPPWLDVLDGVPRSRRLAALSALVAGEVRAVLQLPPSFALEPSRGLFEVGLGSLTSLELRERLQSALALPLPSTLIFDRPNLLDLCTFLLAELDGGDERGDAPAPVAASLEATIDGLSDEEAEQRLWASLQALAKEGSVR